MTLTDHPPRSDEAFAQTCGIKLHGTVTVWPKGQVVIPKEVRDTLGIEPGDSLITITKQDRVVGFLKMDLQDFMQYMQQEINQHHHTHLPQ